MNETKVLLCLLEVMEALKDIVEGIEKSNAVGKELSHDDLEQLNNKFDSRVDNLHIELGVIPGKSSGVH